MTKIMQYNDLVNIPVYENNEPLVVVQDAAPQIYCKYEKFDMKNYLGDKMMLRKDVVKRLIQAASVLEEKIPDAKFHLVYGYRHPEIQQEYFTKQFEKQKKNNPNLKNKKLLEQTHLLVASPDVAGHPTGGAIDITIITKNGGLDMGTKIADFSDTKKIQTFAESLSHEQKTNRLLLRNLLMEQNFAPFDGEWWHFSYGDKEWASYYKKPNAFYSSKVNI